MNTAIARRRLLNQSIVQPLRRNPVDVVAWLGAVQAQEYQAAKWALALRMPPGATDQQIEGACDQGRVLRTHVMRPTWHFVAAVDIRWMLELTAPRVHRVVDTYCRHIGLDTATRTFATTVFERALSDGHHLTRAELGVHLERAGVQAKGIRLALLTVHAELERVICSGRRRGKHLTYALLAQRAPQPRRLSPDEALAELTRRYFMSHGPATIRDFVWWSGLSTADARRGLAMNKARGEEVDNRTYWTVDRDAVDVTPPRAAVHLLPIYDEYLVAYRDRDAVPHGPSAIASRSRNAIAFQNTVITSGQVAGSWKAVRNAGALTVDVILQRRLSGREQRALTETVARYGRFLQIPVSLSIA